MLQQTDINITVLCENSVGGPTGLIGEHGWAVGITTPSVRILFDTGQGLGIINNCDLLKFNLSRVDKIVLSHGHYDHCSGLPLVLPLTGATDVYIHEQGFGYRCCHSEKSADREIGIRHTKNSLESLGAHFCFNKDFSAIEEGIYLSGEIPRNTSYEKQDPQLLRTDKTGTLQQDPHIDDQTLIIDSRQGLILILGCAHAGIINILNHVQKQLPDRPIHTVIGGTHLGFASDEQFAATVDALHTFDIQCLAAAHCTGLERGAQLAQIFGSRFRFAPVGTRIQIP
ncbi:MAG: MBL fold metallo-hydrolase [Thermodesulfobacteriota bacterium]|nr:MBL fold metallo-hydrolase [Thermodesulfobacteriota bacterium]